MRTTERRHQWHSVNGIDQCTRCPRQRMSGEPGSHAYRDGATGQWSYEAGAGPCITPDPAAYAAVTGLLCAAGWEGAGHSRYYNGERGVFDVAPDGSWACRHLDTRAVLHQGLGAAPLAAWLATWVA